MQIAICVRVVNVTGGFDLTELNNYLSKGFTVVMTAYSTDNSILVILDEPLEEENKRLRDVLMKSSSDTENELREENKRLREALEDLFAMIERIAGGEQEAEGGVGRFVCNDG